MWTGYGYLNSTEIWNNQRTVDYLLGNPDTSTAGMALPTTVVTPGYACGTAATLFCDPPKQADGFHYTTPAEDDAPWYDAAVPESADFAGLFVTEVTGFDSVIERQFTQGAIMGGSLGPLKFGGRTITVTGWLRASTCCGAEYGLRWLQEALVGDSGCQGCALGEFVMLRCCPTEPNPAATNYVRYMEQVGLVDGPKVTDRMGTCCASCGCTNLQVQFTLASESPYIFSEPTWALYGEQFPAEQDWMCFSTKCEDCGPTGATSWTPDCGTATIAPPEPFLLANNCYGDPWCARTIQTGVDNPVQWNNLAGLLVINAGNKDVRNLKVMAWQNTRSAIGIDCTEFFAGNYLCAPTCFVVEIAQLPAGSTLTIDSRTRVVALQLAGGVNIPGLKYITGEDGGPFNWIEVPHCSSLCVQISADCSVADDAAVTLGFVNKYLASGG